MTSHATDDEDAENTDPSASANDKSVAAARAPWDSLAIFILIALAVVLAWVAYAIQAGRDTVDIVLISVSASALLGAVGIARGFSPSRLFRRRATEDTPTDARGHEAVQSSSTPREDSVDSASAFSNRLLISSVIVVVLVFAGCLAYAIGAGQEVADVLLIFVSSIALVGAAGVGGAFLGLLFGLPREVEVAARREQLSNARFSFNNNLLKVSDWITTIVVGLTLVNLSRVPSALRTFGDWVAPALGGKGGSAQFGVFTLIFGATIAFIIFFAWTTISFRGELEKGEQQVEGKWKRLIGDVVTGTKTVDDARKEFELEGVELDTKKTPS